MVGQNHSKIGYSNRYSTWLRNVEMGVSAEDEEEPQPGTSAGGGCHWGCPPIYLSS